MGNKDGKNLQYAGISSKNKMTSQSRITDLRISPKGTNIPGHHRECEEGNCSRLIPCPHVRCQEHRTDMAIKNWVVEHIEP
jgi:hypothetical protein